MTTQCIRLFIVEDQRLIAADLENTLRKLGYEVVGNATSGEEAIEAVTAARPDLVLMDIRLQGAIDGIQAAEAISRRIEVPIVYVTAYADEETIRRAKVTGPFGYVVKPFNPRELQASIEIALYKHETDRILAEERARRSSAEEFRLVVESVEEYAIYRLDAEGRISSWNAGAERIEGWRAGEIVGRHFSTFYPPESLARGEPDGMLATAAGQGRARTEGWRLRKDGSRYWASVLLTAVRAPTGELTGYLKVVRDSTQRKHREDGQAFLDRATVALASSLEADETVARAATLAVPDLGDWCLLDLADERGELAQVAVAFANHGAGPPASPPRSLSGRAEDEIPIARRVFRTGSSSLHPAVGPEEAARLLGTELGDPLRRLGTVSYLAVPVRYQGRCQGVLNLLRARRPDRYAARDVTLAEEFARRVGLAIENARHFRLAREAICARDEFLQVASHELKTPLTPLQIQLDSIQLALGRLGVRDETLLSKIERAIHQTVRLTRLVESLLDVTRITSGHLPIHRERMDLAALVRDVVARFEPEARQAGCEIEVETPDEVVGAWDRLRLEQVLSNLLSNAIKYGAGRRVHVELEGVDHLARLAVADQGIGIANDSLRRIFEPFERAVPVRHYGGLGLGLFIARRIVEAHGGRIEVESEPGNGSTFTVLLPVEPGAEVSVQ